MATFNQDHVKRVQAISNLGTTLTATITNGANVSDYAVWLQIEDIRRHLDYLASTLNPSNR